MQQIGETKKPLYFLNTGKFWDIFGKMFVHMQHAGFIANMDDYNMTVCATPEELIKLIVEK
jgi:predicted Rossmann-fold nucleotide-binding protein